MSNPLRRVLADASRERRLRAWSIGLATFLLAASINIPLAASAMYEGIAARDAARQFTYFIDPTAVNETGDVVVPNEPEVAKVAMQEDRAGWDIVTVVTLAVIDGAAPPPPGIDRWPNPGEVFASPALIADAEGPALIASYGKLAGAIDPTTLPLPSERFAWVGADIERMSPLANGIPSFGRVPYPLDGGRLFSMYNTVGLASPLGAWWLAAAMFLIAPSLVHLFTSLRLGAERRQNRLAVLRTLGASPRQARRALIAELGPPAVSGAAAATLASLAATLGTWTIPIIDAPVIGSDLRAHVASLLVGPVVSLGIAWAVMVWSDRARRRPPGGTRPVTTAARERSWPVIALAASVLAANYGYAHFHAAGRPDLGVLVILGCGTLAALMIVFLTRLTLRWLSMAIARHGARHANATALLVAGREISALGRPVVRATTTISVAALIVVHVWALATISTTEARNARAAVDANAGITAELRTSNQAVTMPEVAGHLPDGVVLLQASPDGAVLSGTCADLAAVVGSCEAEQPPELLVPQLRWYAGATARVEALDRPGTATSTSDSLATAILVSTTGEPLEIDAITARLRAEVSPFVEVKFPLEGWLASAMHMLYQSRWIVAAAALGVVIVLLTAAATMTFEIARASRRFAALGVLEGRRRFYLLLGAGSVGLPILVAALGGTVIGLAQNGANIVLDDRLTFPWMLTVAMVVASALVAVAGGLVAGSVTRRAASTWRSTVEE